MACYRSSCSNYHPHAEELCEPCEEYEKQVRREINGYSCQHCGSTYISRAAFDQHAWQIYYRAGYRPLGRRVKL